MQQSPSWEATPFSASQEILHILWNPKVHYRIRKCSRLLPILRQIDLVCVSSSHFLKIHLNIILPYTPVSSKWFLSLRFPHQNPIYTSPLPHTCYTPSSSNSSLFYHPNNIWWGAQIIKLKRWYQFSTEGAFMPNTSDATVFVAARLCFEEESLFCLNIFHL